MNLAILFVRAIRPSFRRYPVSRVEVVKGFIGRHSNRVLNLGGGTVGGKSIVTLESGGLRLRLFGA